MASYSLYSINFFDDALQNLERFLKKYPVDENIVYAYYLISIINFEQISDEKKDIGPLLTAKDDIDFFLKKFPESEYAIDLRFKRDLVINQLAAKEVFVAKYYISTQKWIPAINRFKTVINDYETTIYVEEALHRLVELHYKLGLVDESKKYASLLGYNYQSSEWYEESYKILNKNYVKTAKKVDPEKERSILQKFKDLLK